MGGEKKEKPSPQRVLDVVPNSKVLLGLPSASNKIAGHPERPQGGERTLLSPLAPGPQQLCSVSAPQSPAVTGSLCSTLWPLLGLDFQTVPHVLFTSNRSWCFGSQKPWRLVSLSQTPSSVIEICPSPAGVFGEAVTRRLWLHSGKTRVPYRPFLSSFFNAIHVCCLPHTGKCLPFSFVPDADSQLNFSTAFTISQNLKL